MLHAPGPSGPPSPPRGGGGGRGAWGLGGLGLRAVSSPGDHEFKAHSALNSLLLATTSY